MSEKKPRSGTLLFYPLTGCWIIYTDAPDSEMVRMQSYPFGIYFRNTGDGFIVEPLTHQSKRSIEYGKWPYVVVAEPDR